MAFALRLVFLLCAICGLFTKVSSLHKEEVKDNNCPKGWTRLDCHCYIYQRNPRMLADAESICNILGGNVMSIHNSLENVFVHELFKREAALNDTAVWTGLHDTLENNEFLWIDGVEFDFSAFDTANGEPNATASGCVSLALDDGLWDTEDCSTEYPYICLMDVMDHSH
ncbi:lithostathine-1-beta-like [Corythoichthys intestinalis]|uniref:lithostathine-1-beta-like n=1 Tax=Corythoichthys intestinalis TaxID=161448 RepID=UPI0025A67616|nr:lithostathine-1-beta-like [Corythoichthys intestinalis]XP_061812428.1 lithostathine-1-beta-like [Nerophis lumbriciformis]